MRTELPAYHFEAWLQEPEQAAPIQHFSKETADRVLRFHRQLPGYVPTPLVSLQRLARNWNLGGIFVKDEATRFGLKAFKALGGSYAVARLVCRELGIPLEEMPYEKLVSPEIRRQLGKMTFVTATDGNHGRGIAWAAEQLGQKAVVYMPTGTARSRVLNIRSHGATVEVTDLNYDDTVRLAGSMAVKKGWHLVQDTSREGYEDVPRWVMQGYLTMCREVEDHMTEVNTSPTHVFLQAGVGSLAGAVIGYFANRFRDRMPRFVIVEPRNAACFLASALAGDGRPHAVTGNLDTIMAGLACGEPNPSVWEILRGFPSAYIACGDFVAANGIRILANPLKGDSAVEAGESGSVGVGLLDLLANHKAFSGLRTALEIGPTSQLLFFNTEGATDPVSYREILWHGKYSLL